MRLVNASSGSHKFQGYLLSFSSDEVELLLVLRFAGSCSDLLPSTNSAKSRVRPSIAQVQECLLDTAQQEWLAKRWLGPHGVRSAPALNGRLLLLGIELQCLETR